MSLRWFRVLNLSCQFRGFIKAWVLGKLTGCEGYYAHLVLQSRRKFLFYRNSVQHVLPGYAENDKWNSCSISRLLVTTPRGKGGCSLLDCTGRLCILSSAFWRLKISLTKMVYDMLIYLAQVFLYKILLGSPPPLPLIVQSQSQLLCHKKERWLDKNK